MNKKSTMSLLKFVVCLLFSSHAFSFQVGQSWYRHENGYLEFAVREYWHPESLQHVSLLPVINIADSSYFKKISEQFRGKTVLYQMTGTWEHSKQFLRNLDVLDETHKNRFFKMQKKPLVHQAAAYGLSFVDDHLDFDQAQNLIHVAAESTHEQPFTMPWLDQAPDRWVDEATVCGYVTAVGDRCTTESCVLGHLEGSNLQLDEMADAVVSRYTKDLPSRVDFMASFVQFLIEKEESGCDLTSDKESIQNILIRLQESASTQLAITFKILGMKALEEALHEKGFQPVENSQQWFQVVNLMP